MPNHLRTFSFALLVGGLGLAPGLRSLPASGDKDLDQLTVQQLDADLEAELDDIYAGHSPTERVDLDDLHDEIMFALGDAEDDGLEADIDLEDLHDEMTENGTTLDEVVTAALEAVDEASGPRLRSPTVHYAAFGAPPSSVRTTRQLAVKQTKREIIRTIQAVRR